MAELKTAKTGESVATFLNQIDDEQKRKDAKAVDKLMRAATGAKAKMWGASIVGYGAMTLDYANGKTGEWMQIGFSPRKANLTLYIMDGFSDYASLLAKLGKHKTGKSCLYVKRLSDIDVDVLSALIEGSVRYTTEREANRA